MKKITFLFLLISNFLFAQTASVDVSELSNVSSVDVLANFGGNFDFYPATDAGSDVWTFDFSASPDPTNEYLWRVTFADTSTDQEAMASKIGGKGLDNDVAIGQAFNTDYSSYCNRIMTIGGTDQAFYFNSFRIPGVNYTELVVNAPSGDFYYMRYSVNEFSTFGGPGTLDNGDGTHTALVRPDVPFEYLWNNNNTEVEEDLLTCENDGTQINTDNTNYANRIHAAGVADDDIFNTCPPPLSVGDFEVNNVNVYPNPTQSVWNIQTNSLTINSIQIVDIQGRIVLDINPNASEAIIDAFSLPTGLYFSRINTSTGTTIIKLIKQ
tara:strand:+ start:2489 stop:3460 length:972 start_codon:yes stop_codon:yes gene_type:complete